MRLLRISLNTTYSECKPRSSISFILSKSSCPYSHISPLPPPHSYRLTPNHLHSYAPHAQTTSIYHAATLSSLNPQETVQIHTAFPILLISPSSVPFSPDWQPSSPRFQSYMSIHSQALYIFPFMRYDAPRAVRIGDNFLNLAQAHLTLALAASSAPPPAPSVSPK